MPTPARVPALTRGRLHLSTTMAAMLAAGACGSTTIDLASSYTVTRSKAPRRRV